MQKFTKIISHLFLLALLVAIVSSCECDNSITGENGKPTIIKTGDQTVYFYYHKNSNQLSQTKEIQGSIWNFSYEGDSIITIAFSPEDTPLSPEKPFTRYTKKGNTITIEQATPSSDTIRKHQLELDDNSMPVKITDLGIYSHTEANGEIIKTKEGEYYSELVYDPTSKNLLTQTIYNKETSEMLQTYRYEYDNKPGAVSKVDLPIWFYAFYAYTNRDFRINNYNRVFFNYSNNLIRETTTNVAEKQQPIIIIFNLQYNADYYPTLIGYDFFGGGYLSISY